ncbi:ornithine cyclodeaminase family protein [Pseudomonas sp. PA15(2017)]|uniref:ornithine cyclodeaminase family protein n=1 Tax=Pseudomonas sp. PA15(2017) TaxID=1932111 RepID=UPI000969A4C4|nr:ornithine cyclodeaminase family protein [Pseudomonas sp. PA15(2017)]OLU34882.1 ornithine cyclodeaminase family protein [Pseudomonas sp. PA15(2017)]
MQFIDEATATRLIDHEVAFGAIRAALIAACHEHARIFPVLAAHGSNQQNTFMIKSAAGSDIAGLKVGSYWPGNTAKGLACHNSLILLFDQNQGKIDTIIESGVVNAYRTAAADAVAASVLAREDAKILAIFGTGHQAHYECLALARVRPIEQVLVVARTPKSGEAMIRTLAEHGLSARLSDAQTACGMADIVVTATTSTAPLFDAAWIQPGTHIASMGSDAFGKQELPPSLFARAHLFCDLVEQSRRIGEFQHADAALPITAIGEVLQQRAQGRRATDDITIFDSSGIALQDLHVGRAVLEKYKVYSDQRARM